MGVAGCGKTTIGEALAKHHGWHYVDGDKLHPTANIEKMSSGLPLNDDDRKPWLELVGKQLKTMENPAAIGCSALKRSYRDIIRQATEDDVCFLFLNGFRELIEQRMAERKGHFMPLSLLDSQFTTLEPPTRDETFVDIDISGDLPAIMNQIIRA